MGTDAHEVQTTPEAEETPVEKKEEGTPKGLVKEFEDFEPRSDIYAKSDSLRFPAPPEAVEEEEAPEQVDEEKPEGDEKAESEKEADKTEAAKEPEEEKPTPREKRKAENLADKEKRLSAWEQNLVAQFEAAGKPPVAKPTVDASQVPLRYMTEDQIQARYDELAIESPYRAKRFLDSVEVARETMRQESEGQRIESDFRDFRDAYKDVTEADWLRMNDPSFYEKYPDIMKSMSRRDYFATFVAARSRLFEEKVASEREAAKGKESALDAELRRRNELKKKGQVLRVQTRQEPITPKKDEGPKDPIEERRKYIRNMAEERRTAMGLGPPRT